MRKILLTLSFLLASSLFAQTADLQFLSASPSVTPTTTGVRFAMFARWRNDGPNAAHAVRLTVTGSPTPFFIVSVATSGWPCYSSPEGNNYTCVQDEFAAGGEAELVLQMFAPSTPGPFNLRLEIHSAETDPNPDNNTAQLSSVLTAAPSADLSISPTSQLHRADAGSDITIPILVANNGATRVRNVATVLMLPFTANTVPPLAATGEGWSCLHPPYGPQAVLCTRLSLEAGEVAPLTVTTTAPAAGTTFTVNARVGGEDYSDPSPANNAAAATITSTAEAESWSRVLLPLVGPDAPGTNGALWRTQVTALIASDTAINIEPLPCDVPACTVAALPLRTPFDVFQQGLAKFAANGLGHFLYVHSDDEGKLHVNARVYDVSRSTETAGSEIPIVHEADFTNGRISLLGIPVASQYHHTLRIYDFDGRAGAEVSIRFYAGLETTPRLSVTRTLTGPSTAHTVAGGPVQPATIQLEVGQLLALGGIDTLRVDIEPLDPTVRLWSFVSVTNNDTHHVTTFSSR
jgi:hypothetical protein